MEEKSVSHALTTVFKESSDFLVIGFTGRTGSGCSTCAKILTDPRLNLPEASKSHYSGNEQRKFRIIKKYIENYWQPFKWLRVTSVITRYMLEISFEDLSSFISKTLEIDEDAIKKDFSDFKEKYQEASAHVKKFLALPENTITEIENKKSEAYS